MYRLILFYKIKFKKLKLFNKMTKNGRTKSIMHIPICPIFLTFSTQPIYYNILLEGNGQFFSNNFFINYLVIVK